MKKIIAAVALALMALGLGAGASQADPQATLCTDVNIVVNGQTLVSDAQCNILPPQ